MAAESASWRTSAWHTFWCSRDVPAVATGSHLPVHGRGNIPLGGRMRGDESRLGEAASGGGPHLRDGKQAVAALDNVGAGRLSACRGQREGLAMGAMQAQEEGPGFRRRRRRRVPTHGTQRSCIAAELASIGSQSRANQITAATEQGWGAPMPTRLPQRPLQRSPAHEATRAMPSSTTRPDFMVPAHAQREGGGWAVAGSAGCLQQAADQPC